MTVPVSGEDQPDPRVEALIRALSTEPSDHWWTEGQRLAAEARHVIAFIDVADATAGIRRTRPDPQLTEDSHRTSDALYAAVARLSDGDELRSDELAVLLVRAAETLGRHRA